MCITTKESVYVTIIELVTGGYKTLVTHLRFRKKMTSCLRAVRAQAGKYRVMSVSPQQSIRLCLHRVCAVALAPVNKH